MEWTEENGLLLIPLGLGWLAVWLLMPSERKRPRILGGLAGLAAILIMQMMLLPPAGDFVRNGLFFLFAAGSVISAALMITDRNPVYSALWFALVTLSVCGLFLLNSAPFLAAATIIVYAGAIIGRCAGRIDGGRITVDGTDHLLSRNEGDATLHGGAVGFDGRMGPAWPVRSAF